MARDADRPLPARRRSQPRVPRAHFGRPAPTTPLDRALRLDTEIMLVDDPVKRVDNMTMAWGWRRARRSSTTSSSSWRGVPADLKLAHGGKGVLKDAARASCPRS